MHSFLKMTRGIGTELTQYLFIETFQKPTCQTVFLHKEIQIKAVLERKLVCALFFLSLHITQMVSYRRFFSSVNLLKKILCHTPFDTAQF